MYKTLGAVQLAIVSNHQHLYFVLGLDEFFKEDSNTTFASGLLKLERNTVNNWYNYFREIIYNHVNKEKEG